MMITSQNQLIRNISKILFLGIFFFGVYACQPKLEKDEVLIKAHIKNQGNEPLLLLFLDFKTENYITDTLLYFKDSKLNYRGKLKHGGGLYVLSKLNRKEAGLLLFLDNNGVITIKGDNKTLPQSTVSGSKAYNAYIDFGENYTDSYVKRRQYIESKLQEAFINEDSALVVDFYTKNNQLTDEEMKMQGDYIIEHPDNFFSLHMLFSGILLNETYLELGENAYNHLSEELKQSYNGKITYNKIQAYKKQKEEGEIIPEFQIKWPFLKNEIVYFEEIVAQNKLTLLNFEASFVLYCRINNKYFYKALYEKYKDKGFEIISFSMDTDIETFERTSSEDKVTWKSLCDLNGFESDVPKIFDIKTVPNSLLIDAEGNILGKNLTPKELESHLSSSLDQ